MKIGLHDNDKTSFPNLALMKLSAWHKKQNDDVSWFMPLLKYDRVYSSKVFTYTPLDPYLPSDTLVIKGGLGHDYQRKLSFGESVLKGEIEHICPDYSLYDLDYSMGFLTRGCHRKCKHCFVPQKEGQIRSNANLDEFLRHVKLVVLDNNILASEHGIYQIEQMSRLGLKVDFNQGLDARLINNSIAKLLSKLRYIDRLRMSCDSISNIKHVHKAVELLRWHNTTPRGYFVYVLVEKDIHAAVEIVRFLKGMRLDPFAQPYMDEIGTKPTKEQRAFARWVNHKAEFKSRTWEDYWKAHSP